MSIELENEDVASNALALRNSTAKIDLQMRMVFNVSDCILCVWWFGVVIYV